MLNRAQCQSGTHIGPRESFCLSPGGERALVPDKREESRTPPQTGRANGSNRASALSGLDVTGLRRASRQLNDAGLTGSPFAFLSRRCQEAVRIADLCERPSASNDSLTCGGFQLCLVLFLAPPPPPPCRTPSGH